MQFSYSAQQSNRQLVRAFALASLLICFTAGAALAWSAPLALAVLGVVGWVVLSVFSPFYGTLALIAYTSLHPVWVKVLYEDHPVARVWKDAAVVWLLVMWLVHRTRSGERPLRWGITETALAGFIMLTVVHLFNPNIYSLTAALADVRWITMPLLFYFMGKTLFAGERSYTLLVFFGVMAAFHAVYGIVQQFMPTSWLVAVGATPESTPSGTFIDGQVRSFSTMDPYLFGALMSFGAVVALAELASGRGRWLSFWTAVVVLTSLGAVLSFARYAWVMLWVGCVSVGAWTRQRLSIALAVAALIVLQLPLEGLWRQRVQDVRAPFAPTSTVSVRIGFWKKGLQHVWEHPFGLGLGTLGIGKWSSDNPQMLGYGTGADNNYLYILVETGWVGLALYLGALGGILATGWRAIRRTSDTLRRARLVALWTLVLQSAVGNMVNFSTFLPPVSWCLWLCAGALMAQAREEPNDDRGGR